MDRRKFIRGTGLFGGLIAGVVAGKTVIEKIHTKEIINAQETVDANYAPTSTVGTLHLQTDNPDLSTKKQVNFGSNNLNGNIVFINDNYYASQYEVVERNAVSMAAGKDNRLWIKVNDEWYRLSVDKTV